MKIPYDVLKNKITIKENKFSLSYKPFKDIEFILTWRNNYKDDCRKHLTRKNAYDSFIFSISNILGLLSDMFKKGLDIEDYDKLIENYYPSKEVIKENQKQFYSLLTN